MGVIDSIKKWWQKNFALEVQMDDDKPQLINQSDPEVESSEPPECECDCCCDCEECIPCKPVVTLRDAFNNYIYNERGRLSDTTLNGYETIRDRHLQFIMDEELLDLTQEKVQTALDNEINKGLSEKTVKKYRSLLLKLFDIYCPVFKPELTVKPKETGDA